MQRQHLIIIAIVVFALVACAGSVFVALLLWPSPDAPDQPTDIDVTDRPVLPEQPPVVDRELPQPGPRPIEPESAAAPLDPGELLPGVWQCAQGNDRQPLGSAYQFFTPVGTSGTVYLTDDPSAQDSWIEAAYELGQGGYLVISPVSYVGFAVSSSYAVQFADADTMYMWSLETGDENMPPSIMVRVQ